MKFMYLDCNYQYFIEWIHIIICRKIDNLQVISILVIIKENEYIEIDQNLTQKTVGAKM